MTESDRIAIFPTDFQAESLRLVESFVPSLAMRFFLIDPHMNIKGWVGSNMEIEVEQNYQKEYWHLDPMHPRNFAESEETVICSHDLVPRKQWLQSIFYQDFIKPLGAFHDADVFFRRDGEIIAVLTILRSEEQGMFSPEELDHLRRLQPYMEYTLNMVYLPARFMERRTVQEFYELTSRELDVLEHAMAGASNKTIAEKLGMSLPTVRTHLQHTFEKVEVRSTVELVAKIYRILGFRPILSAINQKARAADQ